MYNSIKNFAKQFEYEPVIKNAERLGVFNKFIVVGMGGSRLSALIAKTWKPNLSLTIHNDYGLPEVPPSELRRSLIIFSSYSGNTEEVLDAYESARKNHYAVAVISVGGKLTESAIRDGAPYIELPDTGIQPRSALGFSLKALLKMMREDGALAELRGLAGNLLVAELESAGKALALKLKDHIPVIYASNRNQAVAYNWKIKFNETGKVPAFCAVLPELNHNEMTGFDITPSTAHLAKPFYFIFLRDAGDSPRIQRRMEVLSALYSERGLSVEMCELRGMGAFHKIFSSLVLADWTAYHTALIYGRDPREVPMVEEFKRLLTK